MARFMEKFAVCNISIPPAGKVPAELYARLPRANFIDGLVWDKLQRLGITPSEPANDTAFLRRAYLDTIGRLPTPEEVRAFLADKTTSGSIDAPGDIDVYQFLAKKGQQLSFRIDARSVGSQLDPLLRLTDVAGKRLAQADDAAMGKPGERDVILTFTVPQGGSYLLELHDQNWHGSHRHFYRLRAVGLEPDYALSVTSDRFVLAPGKPLDILVSVTRRDGFDNDIEITLDGLPANVTAKSVRSVGAGGKTVTLRLEANGEPISAASRIVGHVAEQADLTRKAVAPRIKLPETTPYLWLNVKK